MTPAPPPFTGRDLDLDAGELTGLRPGRLLDHARQLSARGSATTNPRTVHARRSISAAYYALFHRVTINLAWRASTDLPGSVGWALCRTFSHGTIKDVTDLMERRPTELRKSTPPPPTLTSELLDLALAGTGMSIFAQGFGQLQHARHTSDYDHFKVIDRLTALQAVRQAETLVKIVEAVYPEPAWQAFTTLVLLRSKIVHHP